MKNFWTEKKDKLYWLWISLQEELYYKNLLHRFPTFEKWLEEISKDDKGEHARPR
jgi:hypothetical protein